MSHSRILCEELELEGTKKREEWKLNTCPKSPRLFTCPLTTPVASTSVVGLDLKNTHQFVLCRLVPRCLDAIVLWGRRKGVAIKRLIQLLSTPYQNGQWQSSSNSYWWSIRHDAGLAALAMSSGKMLMKILRNFVTTTINTSSTISGKCRGKCGSHQALQHRFHLDVIAASAQLWQKRFTPCCIVCHVIFH